MDEKITNAEINSLLKSVSSVVDETSANGFSPDENKKVVNLLTTCYESVSSALSVLLSKDVTFNGQTLNVMNSNSLEELEFGKFITAEVPFGGELIGKSFLLLETPVCSAASDLLLGGEGKKDREINAEIQDTMKEIFNQILGTLETALSSSLGFNARFQKDNINLSAGAFNAKEIKELTQWVMFLLYVEIPKIVKGKFIHIIPRNAVTKFFEALDEAEPEEDVKVAASESFQDDDTETGLISEQEPTFKPKNKYDQSKIDMILDIELPISVRLGEADITIHDVLQLCPGSIIELDRSVEESVDVIVNNKLIAKGEVVVVDSYFALKITEIKSHAERIKSLGKD
jgi:flagellar motor switch protein FliN